MHDGIVRLHRRATKWQRIVSIAGALMVFIACSSTTTGSTECDNVAGKYAITSECLSEPVVCQLDQNDCRGTVSCSGMSETEVEITTEKISFSMNLGPCVGAPNDDGFNGACTSSSGMICDFAAARVRSGDCGGLTWTDGQRPACDACAEAYCCDELKACAPGTPCSTLLFCITDKCPTVDPACVMSMCSAEYAAGGSDAESLRTCVPAACAGCM
jgi:hypothetical protein